MPQMHERVSLSDAVPQLLLVGLGVALIYSVTTLMHHGHEHEADAGTGAPHAEHAHTH